MKPKKIAILYSGAKYSGGVETYLVNLFKYADPARVGLELFSLGDWPLLGELQKLGVHVQTFSGGRINLMTIYRIARALRTGGFKLIVSQGTVANAYARAASLLAWLPSLVTVHSDKEADYPNDFIRVTYKLSDLISRWRTKKYIAVSNYLKEKIVKTGIPEGKIEMIYNGVEARSKLLTKQKNEKVRLGSIGRLHKVKNYSELISAMKELSQDCDLIIFGEGVEKDSLQKKIDELRLSDVVTLSGSADDVWGALSSMDIYIQPSLSEGFGLTVVEAQLSGFPVVVTPGGALTELVTDGETGVVAGGFKAEDIASAVKRFLKDPQLAQNCAQIGQKVAKEKFNIEVWADETVNAYLEAEK